MIHGRKEHGLKSHGQPRHGGNKIRGSRKASIQYRNHPKHAKHIMIRGVYLPRPAKTGTRDGNLRTINGQEMHGPRGTKADAIRGKRIHGAKPHKGLSIPFLATGNLQQIRRMIKLHGKVKNIHQIQNTTPKSMKQPPQPHSGSGMLKCKWR